MPFNLFRQKRKRRSRLAIEPPSFLNSKNKRRFVFQEECCWGLFGSWTVPAKTLQVASALDADFIEPATSWADIVESTTDYDECYLVLSYPLWIAFEGFAELDAEIQRKFTLIINPGTAVDWVAERLPTARVVPIDYNFVEGPENSKRLPAIAERFYRYFDGSRKTTIQAASGCPFGCRYCVWRRRRTRWADAAQVAELSANIDNAYILAPQLTGNPDWVSLFVARRREMGKYTRFKSTLNCAHIDKYSDDIRQLSQVGLHHAEIGTEAFSDSALKKLGCSHTVDQEERMLQLAAELGLSVQFELRSGYGETSSEIEEMADNLERIGLRTGVAGIQHKLHIGPLYYWPGTMLPIPNDVLRRTQNGIETVQERLSDDQKVAWNRCYKTARDAGWNIG